MGRAPSAPKPQQGTEIQQHIDHVLHPEQAQHLAGQHREKETQPQQQRPPAAYLVVLQLCTGKYRMTKSTRLGNCAAKQQGSFCMC
jgi:hypothetical protein